MASLLTIIVVNHKDRLGGIPRNLVRCYAVAPARCMSLNLAVKYADVINSVILQVSVIANSKFYFKGFRHYMNFAFLRNFF